MHTFTEPAQGPRVSARIQAQIWFEFRTRLITLLLIIAMGITLGFISQIDRSDPLGHGLTVSGMTILLMILMWDEHLNGLIPKRNRHFWHLPVTNRIRNAAEAAVVVATLSVASLAYWVLNDTLLNGTITTWPVPVFVGPALGLMALAWSSSIRRAGLVGRLCLVSMLVLAMWILIDLGASGVDVTITTAMLFALCTGSVSLLVLLFPPWKPRETVPRMFRPTHRDRSNESTFAHFRRAPFSSQHSAQAWYERRSFFKILTGSQQFYSGAGFCSCMIIWIVLDTTGSSFELVHVGLFAGIILSLQRLDVAGLGYEFRLPQSDWRIAQALLQFSALALLAVLGAVTFLIILVILLFDTTDLHVQAVGVSILKATLVGWCSMALAPGILVGSVITLMCGLTSPQYMLAVFTCTECISIALLVLFPRAHSARRDSLTLLSVMACLAAVMGAQLFLPTPGEATGIHRMVYEVLGAMLVLSLIVDQRQLGNLPSSAARALSILLIGGTVLSLWLSPNPAYSPVAPAGFGAFPPLLLPLILAPRYVYLARRGPEWNAALQRKMQ